eukprot:TCONS_00057196-protein
MVSFDRGCFIFCLISLVISSVYLYAIDEILLEEAAELFEESDSSREDDDSAFDIIAKTNQAVMNGKNALFEGDIRLADGPEGDPANQNAIRSETLKRALRRDQEYLWIDRVVPYDYSDMKEYEREDIDKAMAEISSVSCIKFVKHTNERNWVRFVKENGCWSSVGRLFWGSFGQKISLGSGCFKHGIIIHEILHALGFWHEQSRPDRNQYVQIMWENIADGQAHNFEKYSNERVDDLGSIYDYSSIMHYGKKGFSKNDKPTILVIGDPNQQLGQRDKLSTEDI